MGRGEDRELLQVYRFLFGEVGRTRRYERELDAAVEQVSQATEVVADADREILRLREECDEIDRSETHLAERLSVLEAVVSIERADAAEAALWLEAIEILATPEPRYMAADEHGFPVRCLRCGGDKARGAEDGAVEGGFLCWVCWYDRTRYVGVGDANDYVNEWFNLKRRDFPR